MISITKQYLKEQYSYLGPIFFSILLSAMLLFAIFISPELFLKKYALLTILTALILAILIVILFFITSSIRKKIDNKQIEIYKLSIMRVDTIYSRNHLRIYKLYFDEERKLFGKIKGVPANVLDGKINEGEECYALRIGNNSKFNQVFPAKTHALAFDLKDILVNK